MPPPAHCAPPPARSPPPPPRRPQLDDIESLNYDDLKSVAKLSSGAQYADVMARVTAALDAPEGERAERTTATLEDDPTYRRAG